MRMHVCVRERVRVCVCACVYIELIQVLRAFNSISSPVAIKLGKPFT